MPEPKSQKKSKNPEKDFLAPAKRAEDIILGALGFDEEASIITIASTSDGFAGTAKWADGETFEFQSEDSPSELELWALKVLSER